MNKEKLIEQIMKDMVEYGEPVTREEAEEMAEMEIRAKDIKNYTQSTVGKKPREKKIDNDKKKIIEIIAKALTDNGYNAIITNVDKLIEFDNMTVNLIKHKSSKK